MGLAVEVTLIALSTTNTQILVLNIILHQKETGILAEMANSRAGAGENKMNLEYLIEPERMYVSKE